MRTVRVRYKSCLFLIGILLISGLVALFALASTGHVWVVSKATQPENIRLQRNADNSTYNPDSDSRDVTSFVHSESFKSHGKKLEWIGDRILRMANTWSKAYAAIKREHPKLFASPKRILVLPGLLTEYSSYNFAENAFKGGYLGELVQWSDLIAGLYLLHGNLTMVTSIKNLQDTYKAVPDLFDLVITDYMGLVALHSSQIFAIYKCKIRIVDSFGTEPMSVFSTYNYSDPDVGETFTVWNFEHFQQFWTYYPHTPDNSFLGTVVEKPAVKKTGRRLNRGLIYGKSAQYLRFLRNFDTYLNTIGQYMELHSTFPRVPPGTPRHIVNHGVIPQSDLQLFLQSSRLFVGLGFPYDGPGAVEAIANGCPFIQPKFNPPFSKDNNAFFKGKPTRRTVTSQHPYLENFVGEPYVYTVDVGNISSVRQALIRILKQGDLEPFIPYDLTAEGFLARLGSMILYQDFCDGEDLALKKPARSSSNHGDHSAGEAVDGLVTRESCWWSRPSVNSWWSVDLGGDTFIRKIRIYNAPDAYIGKSWKSSYLCPFQVSLLSSDGKEVLKKVFTDDRAVYVWDDVNVLATQVHIETVYSQNEKYMVLCGVEVYGGLNDPPVWPELNHLIVKVSKQGESCTDTCISSKLVCEPVYFKHINTGQSLQRTFKCVAVVESTHYANYFPGVSAEDVEEHHVQKRTCVTNQEPMLLSCAGQHHSYMRLCPCRRHSFGR